MVFFDEAKIEALARLIRSFILRSTTAAGSGHPTSSLSAVELMTTLLFGGFFQARLDDPHYPNNDRLIFSKGHAAPLLYALYAAAGKVGESELLTLRKFGSPLEGHPTPAFSYTEVPTGSLGQGLSVGVGMALNAKFLDKLSYRTFVLLGDSEMAEGSVWEAFQIASYYNLSNLVGILDVNRLGQRGPTMLEYDILAYQERVCAFGWDAFVVDGHSISSVAEGYARALQAKERPVMIIAKTVKGKGVSFIENKDGWHGKTLKQEECAQALEELGFIDTQVRGVIAEPVQATREPVQQKTLSEFAYDTNAAIATRRAYGDALVRLVGVFRDVVVLDGETSNSTYAEFVKKESPHQFFEMFVAEQNMVGAALGLSRRGKVPFVSTFAAFFTRAFDQIRMSQYAEANIKFCGSHAGCSIGEDGSSQMGLEDIALFRTLLGSIVLYPSDAVSTQRLTEEAYRTHGIVYIRTTRKDTPLLYPLDEQFPIGGSKVLRESVHDRITVLAAGITLHEALRAYDLCMEEGIAIRVVDLYSIKPLDEETLKRCAQETGCIITVEDHYAHGGIGEAVAGALSHIPASVYSLAVTKMPHSGKPDELLAYEGISAGAIVEKVKEVCGK